MFKGVLSSEAIGQEQKNANGNQQKTRLEASKPPTYFTTALSLGCFVLPSLPPFYSIVYCERNELLICKVHQFGLGCVKNCVHANQSEYHFRTSLIHFGVVIFGNSMILYSVLLYPFRHSVCSIPGSLYSVLLRTSVNSILLLVAVVGAPIATPVFFAVLPKTNTFFFTFFCERSLVRDPTGCSVHHPWVWCLSRISCVHHSSVISGITMNFWVYGSNVSTQPLAPPLLRPLLPHNGPPRAHAHR